MLWVRYTIVSGVYSCESGIGLWVRYSAVSQVYNCEWGIQLWVRYRAVSQVYGCESGIRIWLWVGYTAVSRVYGCESGMRLWVRYTDVSQVWPEIRELQRLIKTYDMRYFLQHVLLCTSIVHDHWPISKHLYSGIFKDPLVTKHKIFKNRLNS